MSAVINGTTYNYTYDGDGQRVSKTVGGQTTVMVYDAFGNLAAEYGGSGTSPCDTPTCYVTMDHLGSTRMLTDATGSGNVVRYDYEPFGMEISAGTNGRSTAMGYLAIPDSTSLKYTGQYRDPETGLDVFPARTFSNAQGRFQMVDPGNAGAGLLDPQTWNGYGYVGNNPLTYTDPSGMFECATCVGISTGNPVGAVIGGLIDLGEILGAWLGGGGGPPAMPNWSSTAWAVGPDQTTPGVFSDLSSDNPTGDLFGSGNTDQFIFSVLNGSQLTQPQSSWQFMRAYASTAGFLFNFLTGTGPRVRQYGPVDYRTRDLMSSKGFQTINQQIKQACQAGSSSGRLNLSTWQGYKDIPYDIFHSPVGGEVGGYNGTWSTNSGTTQINIVNYAGAYSFFYHAVNNRAGTSGPFRTIKQTFVIKEPNLCGAN